MRFYRRKKKYFKMGYELITKIKTMAEESLKVDF